MAESTVAAGRGGSGSGSSHQHAQAWALAMLLCITGAAAQSTDESAPPATDATPGPAASNEPLPAQPPPAEEPSPKADGSARLEKVVVTANKREQLLTDVPMSISTISGKDLE